MVDIKNQHSHQPNQCKSNRRRTKSSQPPPPQYMPAMPHSAMETHTLPLKGLPQESQPNSPNQQENQTQHKGQPSPQQN